MGDVNKHIGAVISKHRNAKGLSQEKLASLSNIHRTYISLIERGIKSPTLKILNRIACNLEVKLSNLIKEAEHFTDDDN